MVVGADIEPAQLVGFFALRREHEVTRSGASPAGSATDEKQTSMPESRGSIQSSSTDPAGARGFSIKASHAVLRLENAVALAFQIVAQQRQPAPARHFTTSTVGRAAGAAAPEAKDACGHSSIECNICGIAFGLSFVDRFARLARKCTVSAMLVAWSPMRSMFLAMNSRWVEKA